LHAQEEERKRISRELHDVIAQTLVSINVTVAALTHETASNPKALQRKIACLHRVVQESLDIVHRFARQLRPTMLDDLGLIPALESFMKGFMEETGVRVSLKAFTALEQATDSVRTVLYRVAQEALTNVARHAKASRVEVSIQCLDGSIRMEIRDDGQGFDVDEKSGAAKHKRLGLTGMRERVEMIGGTFGVESAPGHPTTVRVDIASETDCAPRPNIEH
jgi:signal transduction histidine kinase